MHSREPGASALPSPHVQPPSASSSSSPSSPSSASSRRIFSRLTLMSFTVKSRATTSSRSMSRPFTPDSLSEQASHRKMARTDKLAGAAHPLAGMGNFAHRRARSPVRCVRKVASCPPWRGACGSGDALARAQARSLGDGTSRAGERGLRRAACRRSLLARRGAAPAAPGQGTGMRMHSGGERAESRQERPAHLDSQPVPARFRLTPPGPQ